MNLSSGGPNRLPQLRKTSTDCCIIESVRGGPRGPRHGKTIDGDGLLPFSLRLMYKCQLNNVIEYMKHSFNCVWARHASSGRSIQIQAAGTESACFVSGVSGCERIYSLFTEPMGHNMWAQPKFPSSKTLLSRRFQLSTQLQLLVNKRIHFLSRLLALRRPDPSHRPHPSVTVGQQRPSSSTLLIISFPNLAV